MYGLQEKLWKRVWWGFSQEIPKQLGFCDGDINKFYLMLRKGVHRYEDMNSWQRLNEISLPGKKEFYSNLTMENITDADFKHARIWDFGIPNPRQYHDLYMQSNALLSADVFEIFCSKCRAIYNVDLVFFFSAPRLAWQICLRKTEVKLELLEDIDMLLAVEKGIKDEMCHVIHRYTKANNEYMKNYDSHKESSFLVYWDVNSL